MCRLRCHRQVGILEFQRIARIAITTESQHLQGGQKSVLFVFSRVGVMAILNRTQTSGCKMREKIPNVERCNFAGREKPLVGRSKNANREDILEPVGFG